MRRLSLLVLPLLAFHCSDEDIRVAPPDSIPRGTPTDSGAPLDAKSPPSPLEDLPVVETLLAEGLSGPVDLVRDDFGIPHIEAATLPDAAFAQGYVMAQDRWIQMDFARRQASGRLQEVVGPLSRAAKESDIRFRAHRLRKTSEDVVELLRTSTDSVGPLIYKTLQSFARGVNAWQAALKAGKYTLPEELSLLYSPASITPWDEADSVLLGELQAFSLGFDAEAEIARSLYEEKARAEFAQSADPRRIARANFLKDYFRVAPLENVFTVSGWGEAVKIGASRRGREKPRAAFVPNIPTLPLSLLEGARSGVHGVGLDRENDPSRGSNNWVIAPGLSASGKAMLANDTHLSLSNPAIFYFSHLMTHNGIDVMGAQFPGIPLVILGHNRNVSWGGTVSYVDATDVYAEDIAPCPNATDPCVRFRGASVPLAKRDEVFRVGTFGELSDEYTITYYDVPHHGPIVPRLGGTGVEPLSAQELSVRFTGYEPGRLLRAAYGLATARTAKDGVTAVDQDFTHGGQNWVFADNAGNIAWTQATRVPKRPSGLAPWRVLPGDGSAEWQGYFASADLPHAENPSRGFLVTANSDPLGVTADNDPTNEPEADGSPRYLAAWYDPGLRIARITERIEAELGQGKRLTPEVMASIQKDAVSILGKRLRPTFLTAAAALLEEKSLPGTHPELAALLAGASSGAVAMLSPARDVVSAWTFDTPAGTPDTSPTSAEIADSRATTIMAIWTTQFARLALSDELSTLDIAMTRSEAGKLLVNLVENAPGLETGEILFDDITTSEVETREYIAAKALLLGLQFAIDHKNLGSSLATYRWGAIHGVTPSFFAPLGLDLPRAPRRGGNSTVDVGNHGFSDNYNFTNGAAIRLVAEMTEGSPSVQNVLPGGEVFHPKSPHYADMYALWRKNEAVRLGIERSAIAERARAEIEKNGGGRIRFTSSQ